MIFLLVNISLSVIDGVYTLTLNECDSYYYYYINLLLLLLLLDYFESLLRSFILKNNSLFIFKLSRDTALLILLCLEFILLLDYYYEVDILFSINNGLASLLDDNLLILLVSET